MLNQVMLCYEVKLSYVKFSKVMLSKIVLNWEKKVSHMPRHVNSQP